MNVWTKDVHGEEKNNKGSRGQLPPYGVWGGAPCILLYLFILLYLKVLLRGVSQKRLVRVLPR